MERGGVEEALARPLGKNHGKAPLADGFAAELQDGPKIGHRTLSRDWYWLYRANATTYDRIAQKRLLKDIGHVVPRAENGRQKIRFQRRDMIAHHDRRGAAERVKSAEALNVHDPAAAFGVAKDLK